MIGVETTVPVDTVENAQKHQIFIATSRLPSEDSTQFFSGRRSAQLSFASVEVTVPPGHEKGKLERPKQLPADPRIHFSIDKPVKFSERGGFEQEIAKILRTMPKSNRKVMLFVHGYNTNLTSAVLQLAQFVEDSGYDGVPILFSWASAGETVRYVYDINSALVARDGLVSMFQTLQNSSIEGYDLVAHSMGTFLVMEASRQIALTTGLNPTGKAKNIVLAAPDIDFDLFVSQVRLMPENDRRMVVLVSEDDKALKASRRVAGGVVRVGQAPVDVLAKLGVNAIDLSQIDDTGSLAHSKFRDSPEIAQLLGEALTSGSSFSPETQFSLGRVVTTSLDGAAEIVSGGL